MKLWMHGVEPLENGNTHLSQGSYAKKHASMAVQIWCAQHCVLEYDSDSSADEAENPDLHDEINKAIRPTRSEQ